MNAKEYIKYLLSHESYSFSLEEMAKATGAGSNALKFELLRLSEKGEIVNLRKGFYLIITPRYSSAMKLPVQLYCDKLFQYLKRDYYVGLFSAARFYGASHQQVQRDYLITEKPSLNDIAKNAIDIRFFTTSNRFGMNIQEKRADAGIFKISSPALTLADLIHYQTKLGGINRILSTVEELTEELTETDLKDLLSWYPNKSTLQRMGLMLEELGLNDEFQEMIYAELKQKPFFPVLLSPRANQKAGAVNNRWKIDVNVKLENDL